MPGHPVSSPEVARRRLYYQRRLAAYTSPQPAATSSLLAGNASACACFSFPAPLVVGGFFGASFPLIRRSLALISFSASVFLGMSFTAGSSTWKMSAKASDRYFVSSFSFSNRATSCRPLASTGLILSGLDLLLRRQADGDQKAVDLLSRPLAAGVVRPLGVEEENVERLADLRGDGAAHDLALDAEGAVTDRRAVLVDGRVLDVGNAQVIGAGFARPRAASARVAAGGPVEWHD
jgi:hypothetical protein